EITECIENTPAPTPSIGNKVTPDQSTPSRRNPNGSSSKADVVNVNMTYKSDIMTVSPFYKLDSDYSKNVSMTDTSGKILLDLGAKNGHSNGIVAPYIKNNYVWFRSTGVGCTTVKVSYLTKNNMKRTKIYKVNVKAVGKEAYTKYFKVATGPAWNKKISKVSVNMKSGEKKRPTISWKKVKGATGYEVYRKGNASGYWIKIGNIKKGTRLRFGEVQKGYKVYLKVRPYKVKNGVKYFGKFTSKTVKAKKNVAPVKSGGEHRFSSENAFLLMNKERTKHHVKALKWSEQLYRMALTHAKYNAKKGVDGHEMKKKYKFTTPVLKATKQVGDACALWKFDNLPENVYMTDESSVHSGENCAANYNSPIYFVNAIKKSKPHYKTAMGACYSYSAVAFYEKNGSYKSVEIFDIYNCYKSN
ncbi:MAG: CAP domain-containing protein, partial [Ruminococcus callidus]|nr:CAP domain-containing protein [Ruminococcus callidus]